jgi:polyhydroxybutyrate depolymerase
MFSRSLCLPSGLLFVLCLLVCACASKAPAAADPCSEDPASCEEGSGGAASGAGGGGGTVVTKDGGGGAKAGSGGVRDGSVPIKKDGSGGTGGVKIIPPNGSTGCGKDYDPKKYVIPNINNPIVTDLTISVGGATRTFSLYIPLFYDTSVPAPLAFGFHGGYGSAAGDQEGVQSMSYDTALFVYPQGNPISTGGPAGWNWTAGSPDVALFDALLTQISSDFCVDSNRLFAFGYDMGGYMANALGCYRGDKLRAIGDMAGGGIDYVGCTGQVAAIYIAGSLDTTVTPGRVAVAREAVMQQNNCGPETAPFDPDPGLAPCLRYTGCQTGYDVVWCEVKDLNHDVWSMAGFAVWQLFGSL